MTVPRRQYLCTIPVCAAFGVLVLGLVCGLIATGPNVNNENSVTSHQSTSTTTIWKGIWHQRTSDIVEAEDPRLDVGGSLENEPADDDSVNEGNMNLEDGFAYKPSCFGPSPGTIVSDIVQEDLEIRQLVLSNNIRINLKRTDFEEGNILLAARFGKGTLSLPPKAAGLDRFTEYMINKGGLGLHSQSDLDRLFGRRSVDLNLSIKAGSFVFEGETIPEDLEREVRLLAAYFSDPGYRQEAVEQFRSDITAWMADLNHTLEGPNIQLRAALKGDDPRFLPPTQANLMAFSVDDSRAWIQTQLENSYLEVSLVGALPNSTVDMLLETLGAFPSRASEKATLAMDYASVKFPDTPKILIYPYESTNLDEGAAIIAWEIPSVTAETTEVLAQLRILQEVFQDRLHVEIQRVLGTSTFNYFAHLRSSEAFEYGEFMAVALVDNEHVNIVGLKMVDIGRVLAEDGILQDEFDRALGPFLVREEGRQNSNHHWLELIDGSQANPFYLDAVRVRRELFQSMTAQDVNLVASKFLLPEKAIRFEILPVENKKGVRALRGFRGSG
jgi:zinc protease